MRTGARRSIPTGSRGSARSTKTGSPRSRTPTTSRSTGPSHTVVRSASAMTAPSDLESARAALRMINPAPYNAEAPPAALHADITPTELHYVRSNFALPDHDGMLHIGGAVESPTTLRLDQLR